MADETIETFKLIAGALKDIQGLIKALDERVDMLEEIIRNK